MEPNEHNPIDEFNSNKLISRSRKNLTNSKEYFDWELIKTVDCFQIGCSINTENLVTFETESFGTVRFPPVQRHKYKSFGSAKPITNECSKVLYSINEDDWQ